MSNEKTPVESIIREETKKILKYMTLEAFAAENYPGSSTHLGNVINRGKKARPAFWEAVWRRVQELRRSSGAISAPSSDFFPQGEAEVDPVAWKGTEKRISYIREQGERFNRGYDPTHLLMAMDRLSPEHQLEIVRLVGLFMERRKKA